MTPDTWLRIKSIFAEVIEADPAQRPALLAERCGADTGVRAGVERLLEYHATPTEGRGVTSPPSPAEPAAASHVPDAARPPFERTPLLRASDHIGSYRILKVLGEGGMGIVYLAEQERPRRTVALKMIRPGVATPAMLKRFEHEAEVLGRLHHPGIGQIFEAGTADSGRGPQPYFAMELLRGQTLLVYAIERKLGTRERAELFARVCDAVQHAHENGVIHRDLKPANILVDQGGQPKVLDFGVARVTDADVQATTLRTDMGQLLGTVPYMSPEQATGIADDVDARSDVYSLGVVLYELLTEHLPHELSGRMVHEAVRIIRESEPRRLSHFNPTLRGDIETIVGKALLKERARRYQSAADLAADIRRYLRNEPIAARAPTAAYRIARFAKQHRAHEAAEAMATTTFLQELLASAEPIHSSGKETTVLQILDRAASRLETGSLRDRPELETELRTQIGLTYRALGAFDKAEGHLRAALQITGKIMGAEHPSVTALQVHLGQVVYMLSRTAEAMQLLNRSLETRVRVLGPAHPDVAEGLCALAELHYAEDQHARAEELYRQAIAIDHTGSGTPGAEAAALMGLGGCLVELGRTEEAEPILRRGGAMMAAMLPEGHWRMVATRGLLAACLATRGGHEQAEPLLLETWADLKINPAAPPSALRRTAEHIARLYEQAGRGEAAKAWRLRLA